MGAIKDIRALLTRTHHTPCSRFRTPTEWNREAARVLRAWADALDPQ